MEGWGWILLGFLHFSGVSPSMESSQELRKNVLFIAIDDLRLELGIYLIQHNQYVSWWSYDGDDDKLLSIAVHFERREILRESVEKACCV